MGALTRHGASILANGSLPQQNKAVGNNENTRCANAETDASNLSACEHDYYYIQCTNNGLCTDVAPPYKHCHLIVPHTLYAVLRRQRLKNAVAHHRMQTRDRTRAGRQPR